MAFPSFHEEFSLWFGIPLKSDPELKNWEFVLSFKWESFLLNWQWNLGYPCLVEKGIYTWSWSRAKALIIVIEEEF